MALVFTESFDGVSSAAHLALGKWADIGNVTSIIAGGRNGQGLQIDGNNATHSHIDLATADQHATTIIGFAIKPPSFANAYEFIRFHSLAARTSGTQHVTIYSTGSTGSLYALNVNGTNMGQWTNVLTANVWQYVEFKLVVGEIGAGSIEMKVDQVSKGAFTGDTRYSTEPGVRSIALFAPGSGLHVFDDLYICNGAGTRNNDFLGDCKVECIRPNGNGNSSQLLGSDSNRTDNYLLVDEQAVDDADYVGSAVDGEQDTYAFGNLATTAGTVAGVQLTARALKMDSPAKSVALLSRVGANETAGGNNALTTAHRNYRRMMETDPAAANWTIANVNAAEFGVKIAP